MYFEENIAVLITPEGAGGVSIIQVIGKNVIAIIQENFDCRKNVMPNDKVYYGTLYDSPQKENILDQVLIRCFENKNDDIVVEICCHGGIAIVDAIFILLKNNDIKRVSSELTLDDEEKLATKGLICSKTEFSAKIFTYQLNGAWVKFLENVIFYNDEKLLSSIKCLLSTFKLYKALINPQDVIIAGKPNSGKSTLLNQLLGRERVIVDDIPGTTRDVVRTLIALNGIPFYFCDTAGIRTSNDVVENMGIEKTLSLLKSCQRILWVVDTTSPPTDEVIPEKAIILLNKVDMNCSYLGLYQKKYPEGICISAKSGVGIEKIAKKIFSVILPEYNAIIMDDNKYQEIKKVLCLLENKKTAEAKHYLELLKT